MTPLKPLVRSGGLNVNVWLICLPVNKVKTLKRLFIRKSSELMKLVAIELVKDASKIMIL